MSRLPMTLRGVFALESVKNCWRKGRQGRIRPEESPTSHSARSLISNSEPPFAFGYSPRQRLPLSSCRLQRRAGAPQLQGHRFFASDAPGHHDPSDSNARESTTEKQNSHSKVPLHSTTEDASSSLSSSVSSSSSFSSAAHERSISSAVDAGDETPEDGVLKYGLPERSEVIRKRRNYVVCYSGVHRIPLWVAERLTSQCLSGPAQRRRSRYHIDESIEADFSSTNGDYLCSCGSSRRSHLSRGHLAAAANNKHDQVSMDETFLLTNILPQDRSINSGIWNQIEWLTRRLTLAFKEVHVISGPLLLPNCFEQDERTFLKYEVIGKSEVVVPTHLFKVILAESSRQRSAALCNDDDDDVRDQILLSFVVPNSSIELSSSSEHWKMDHFLTTMDFVERKSGMKLFPRLENKDLVQIEDLEEIIKSINHLR